LRRRRFGVRQCDPPPFSEDKDGTFVFSALFSPFGLKGRRRSQSHRRPARASIPRRMGSLTLGTASGSCIRSSATTYGTSGSGGESYFALAIEWRLSIEAVRKPREFLQTIAQSEIFRDFFASKRSEGSKK
jgi:hypothetical protein